MKIKDFSFRREQIKAIESVEKYKDYYSSKTKKSSLVCMPTGSGKSGVIAYISRNFKSKSRPGVLVLSPRSKITEQLHKECSGRFFEKLDKSLPVDSLPRTCVHLKQGISKIEFPMSDDIYFLTIQKLIKIWKPPSNSTDDEKQEREDVWNQLIANVGLIIIDEGHYEPARNWSECIRSFKSSLKVVFTATPYRNDLKAFDIDVNHSYLCSYDESKSNGNLRNVKFRNPSNRLGHKEFLDHVLKEYDSLIKGKLIYENAKVILRCDDFDAIQKIAAILEEKGKSFYAIHEGYGNSGDPKRIKKVPEDISGDETVFWIHQYKLMEGVDDPSFQLLCNYQKFSNSRSLVQQVGRVIRKRFKKNEVGYVIENFGGREEAIWNTYIEFDLYMKESIEDIFFDVDKYFEDVLNCHPGFSYIGGNFRKRLELPDVMPERDLLLPLSCKLYKFESKIDLNLVASEIEDQLKDEDRKLQVIIEDSLVIVHAGISHSRYLLNHSYLENSLEVIVVYCFGDYVAVYDNASYVEPALKKNFLIHNVDEAKLKKLYRPVKGTLISNVSLINTNLSPNSIRKKSFTARKVSETAISVDDFTQYCSNTLGYSFEDNPFSSSVGDEHVRRYVGYTTGKITQDKKIDYTFREFKNWIELIISKIDGRGSKIKLFDRYSREYKPKKVHSITNILLNLAEVENLFTYQNSRIAPLFEDICADVNASGDFQITISGKIYDCNIVKQKNSDSFKFTSPDLDRDFTPISIDYKNVSSYLNKGQLFSILFSSKDYIYSNGRFFNPEIQVGARFNQSQFNILDFVEDFPELANISSEKGTQTVARNTKWDVDTLFRLIADKGSGTSLANLFNGNTNFLICDDMGVEVADFILVEDDRVVFIHAKASSGNSLVSASSLQEVCAQATKNLSYLSPFNKIPPAGISTKWRNAWSARGVTGTVQNRFIVGSRTQVGTIWDTIQDKLKDPNTKKEVWLMLGNVLSKRALANRLQSTGNFKVALQASLLILSSYQAAYSIGARLRVFSSP